MAHRFLSRLAEAIFDQVPSDQALFRTLDGKGNKVFETSRGMAGDERGGGPILGRRTNRSSAVSSR
ncbi:MAG: hypothetical protein MZV64_12660 [Ignavibacteriales bacterium]|nr:hypothetical protein [Ignavibacteriales bacterium]